jgi:hypothetical protein
MRTEALCVAPNGAFAGLGIACDPGRCLTGVCCSTLGECTTLRSHECDDAGGDFAGVSTTCSADSCATGACCLSTGCEIRTSASCVFSGGVFLGDNSVCDVDNCIPGACCAGVACSREIRFSCEGGGHVFKGPGTTCDSLNVCPCTDNAQCDDGNVCTLNDRCENGSCVNDWRKGAAEFAQLVPCLGGPDQTIQPGCVCFDLNADNRVDLRDVAQFFLAFEVP